MKGNREVILLAIGCAVVFVWSVSVLVQVIAPRHVIPSGVNEVTLAVVAGLFGGAAIAGRKKNGNGNA